VAGDVAVVLKIMALFKMNGRALRFEFVRAHQRSTNEEKVRLCVPIFIVAT
jgi:hypothetical protein